MRKKEKVRKPLITLQLDFWLDKDQRKLLATMKYKLSYLMSTHDYDVCI